MKTMFVVLMVTIFSGIANAEYVNGYYRRDGTYVSGYYRTDPDIYKWNNKSFDGNWNDAYNDRSYYKKYGYDPEPFDNESIYQKKSYSDDSWSTSSESDYWK